MIFLNEYENTSQVANKNTNFGGTARKAVGTIEFNWTQCNL